ncbi:MAG: hypothetical protein WC344_02945 [Bacilli bacterium]|jgi:hypothetical protein
MASIKKFRDNEKRQQLITKLLASFAVAAVVVVTVVIANQEPVTAEFLNVAVLENEIIYRVDVQDPDNRIAGDTLQLEVSGSTERYYEPLAVGKSAGSQIVFGSSDNYTLNISADLGFGREILNSKSVPLTRALAGAILDVRLDPETSQSLESETLTYLVDTKYYDPEAKVESALLEYAYVSEEEYPQPQKYDPDDLQYESIIIDNLTATTILPNISNYNVTIYLRLVVYLFGETTGTILDEWEFATPFRFFGSLYVDDVGMDYALISVFVDNPRDIAIELWVDVYSQANLLTSIPVIFDGASSQSEGVPVRVDDLLTNTPYSASLRTRYVNPDTNEEENITTEPVEFATSQMYQWELTSFIDNGTSYDIVVTTNDPFHIIQSVSCYIIGLDENGNTVNWYFYTLMAEVAEQMVIYSGTISKPGEQYYELTLLLSKSVNQAYYEEIIYTLSV